MINQVAQRSRKTTAGMLIGLIMVLALDVMIGIATSRQAQNPATSEGVPKWEAVSVKRCIDDPAGGDGRGGGAPGPNASPDRYIVLCRPLLGFVQQAYITSTRGQLAIRAIQVQGGPSDRIRALQHHCQGRVSDHKTTHGERDASTNS